MATYRQIVYDLQNVMVNDLKFRFKTHYGCTANHFLRPPIIAEPKVTELEGPAIEIDVNAIKDKKLRKAINQTS